MIRFGSIVLDCPNPRELADFYSRLLRWPPDPEPTIGWATLVNPETGVRLEFQHSDDWRPPTWPSDEVHQMVHLDFDVDDLEVAHEWAIGAGAKLVDTQWAFRVYLDPAGHPFCLVATKQT